MKRLFKDFGIHIILTALAIIIIIKFSSAPVWCDMFEPWLLKPNEETFGYEILRVAENLSLAYIAALMFYIIIDYVPKRKEEQRNYGVVKKYVTEIYANMSGILGYFYYVFEMKTFSNVTEEQKEKIDNFFFPASKEWLLECDSRESVGDSIDCFDARIKIIGLGKKIEHALEEFEKIVVGNRVEAALIDLMYDLKFSGLMEKILKIFSGKRLEIKGMVIQERYLDLYLNLDQFEKIKTRLSKYDFEKHEKTYRKPTTDEMVEWVKVQKEIREKYPYVDDVFKQLKETEI